MTRPVFWFQMGTDFCGDLRCVCGENTHYDGDYLVKLVCSKCGRKYMFTDQTTGMVETV